MVVASKDDPPIDQGTWLTGLLALSPDVVSVMNPQGTLLYVSRVMPTPEPTEVVGREAAEFLPETYRELWRRTIQQVVATGKPQHVEMNSIGEYWWDTRIAPILDPDGRLAYLLAIGTDITARKNAEAALVIKEHQLELALESSGMGQWRWDLEADTIVLDATAREIFAWDEPTTSIPRHVFHERIHPDDRERVLAHFEAARREGRYPTIEYRLATADGSPKWLISTGRVLFGPGAVLPRPPVAAPSPMAVLGGLLDVTKSRNVESARARAQKLEAIGQLAGGVAHDFNNLLVAITGGIELARRETDADLRGTLLVEALSACQRAAELTRQLLAFGRRAPLHESRLDLNAIVQDTLSLLRRLIPASIQLTFQAGDNLPGLRGDRGQIEQVLLNLCINARDALLPKGGSITIGTSVQVAEPAFVDQHPWAQGNRAYLRLCVTDTGVGMTPATLDRVFEPFFTTKELGTGLGLATCYGVAERHGGKLQAKSTVGVGSTFELFLPVDDPAVATRSPSPATSSAARQTILLAEDDTAVRTIVQRILVQAGYDVITAETGPETVALFRRHARQIDLVLMDSILPGMNGPAALAEIRSVAPDVRAILSSAYADGTGRTHEPAALFLSKPYEPDALLRMIRTALASRPAGTSAPSPL